MYYPIWQTKVQINTNLCVDTCIYKYNVLFQVLVKSGNHLIDTYENNNKFHFKHSFQYLIYLYDYLKRNKDHEIHVLVKSYLRKTDQ